MFLHFFGNAFKMYIVDTDICGSRIQRKMVDIPSQPCLTQQYEERIVAENNVLTVSLYCWQWHV